MKTFNFYKPLNEYSFNEILSIIIEIVDEIDLKKIYRKDKILYNITATRDIKNYDSDDEFELNFLSFQWSIGNKSEDSLENQDQRTINSIGSYISYAIDLELIDLKFMKNG